jgi:hypothetical protein
MKWLQRFEEKGVAQDTKINSYSENLRRLHFPWQSINQVSRGLFHYRKKEGLLGNSKVISIVNLKNI